MDASTVERTKPTGNAPGKKSNFLGTTGSTSNSIAFTNRSVDYHLAGQVRVARLPETHGNVLGPRGPSRSMSECLPAARLAVIQMQRRATWKSSEVIAAQAGNYRSSRAVAVSYRNQCFIRTINCRLRVASLRWRAM